MSRKRGGLCDISHDCPGSVSHSQMPCNLCYYDSFGNACMVILANKEMRKLKYENDIQQGRKIAFTQHFKIRDQVIQKKKLKTETFSGLD
jgi:hypothetical protein